MPHAPTTLILAAALAFAGAANAAHRSAPERAAFKRSHPCPANGHRRGACPGYVIDHIEPLCAGGADRVENMQWQSIADARAKDRDERRHCRALKHHP